MMRGSRAGSRADSHRRPKVYIDTSAYNRPFDDQSQPRIWLEALALSAMLQMAAEGEIETVNSDILVFENSWNPFPLRRAWINRFLALASQHQPVDEDVRQRAVELERQGIKPLDALHIASAEAAQCDYFVTCDDRFLRRYTGSVSACTPTELVRELSGDWQ